jgi:hypothetical protein
MNMIRAVLFDLDETPLDLAGSLRAFLADRTHDMLRASGWLQDRLGVKGSLRSTDAAMWCADNLGDE